MAEGIAEANDHLPEIAAHDDKKIGEQMKKSEIEREQLNARQADGSEARSASSVFNVELPACWMLNLEIGDLLAVKFITCQIRVVDQAMPEVQVYLHEDGPADGQWRLTFDGVQILIEHAKPVPGEETLSDYAMVREIPAGIWLEDPAGAISDLFVFPSMAESVAARLEVPGQLYAGRSGDQLPPFNARFK